MKIIITSTARPKLKEKAESPVYDKVNEVEVVLEHNNSLEREIGNLIKFNAKGLQLKAIVEAGNKYVPPTVRVNSNYDCVSLAITGNFSNTLPVNVNKLLAHVMRREGYRFNDNQIIPCASTVSILFTRVGINTMGVGH